MSEATIILGDNRKTLAELPERHFHCCVSSPPYWSLRDYDVEGQIGLEETPEEFVETLVEVYRGVWRVLRDDGVCWVNLGDSYCSTDKWGSGGSNNGKHVKAEDGTVPSWAVRAKRKPIAGLKPKDLMGMPWRVALALQADGWYLRDAVIWHKPCPMPGSQQDRCTTAYEFIFQLTKRPRYFFDIEAIKEPTKPKTFTANTVPVKDSAEPMGNDFGQNWNRDIAKNGGRYHPVTSTPRNVWDLKWTEDDLPVLLAYMNQRHDGEDVWTMASGGFKESHFATFPIELPLRCIKASTPSKGCCSACGAPWQRITERTALKRERPNELTKRTGEDGTGNHCANTVAGVEARTVGWEPTCECGRGGQTTFSELPVVPCRVLDPFNGAGTTAVAARRLGVDYVGCELNEEYIDMSYRRLSREANRGSTLKPVKAAAGQAELF